MHKFIHKHIIHNEQMHFNFKTYFYLHYFLQNVSASNQAIFRVITGWNMLVKMLLIKIYQN
jgi:hypothetical protein